MVQLVTRVEDSTAAALDLLIEEGIVESRSDGVRQGLELLVDRHARARIAAAIVRGYTMVPPTDEEAAWADESTIRMISEEPW